MQYRSFGNTGEKVSALGFGCMRFPTEDGKICEEEAIRMIRTGIDSGLNYVDTAYFYHDGLSEGLVGRALRDGYREKVYLATKSPIYALESTEQFDTVLDEQLSRLQTDHIDFYLLHAVNWKDWNEKVLKLNLLDKMQQARAAGKIRYIGFSFHDDYTAFHNILNGYDHWDFCQIQMNYIDVENQATLKGMEEAAAKGLGVIIMEPLLGGKLANPAPGVKKVLPESKSPVEWALDFLWNRPEVGVVLSGMSSMQQVEDNLLYASRSQVGMLSGEELDMLARAKKTYDTMALVPCTKCSYCMPCPFGVNIPGVFEAYNRTAVNMDQARELYKGLANEAADKCRSCRKCEARCPQHIEVSSHMKEIPSIFAEN